MTVDKHLPLRWSLQIIDQPNQRTLACTAIADHPEYIAFINLQLNSLNGMIGDSLANICLVNVS
ncbi:hypothetical protein D3C81_1858510 [compost metagenome]